jgi:hypothetical protein
MKKILPFVIKIKSRDSSVGIALGYGLDDRGFGVRFLAGAGNFSLNHPAQSGSGDHPASYPIGTRGSFLDVKRPGRETDHSPPSSAEAKECVELYLHSPICYHGVVLNFNVVTAGSKTLISLSGPGIKAPLITLQKAVWGLTVSLDVVAKRKFSSPDR